jgi:hypothetical protein
MIFFSESTQPTQDPYSRRRPNDEVQRRNATLVAILLGFPVGTATVTRSSFSLSACHLGQDRIP